MENKETAVSRRLAEDGAGKNAASAAVGAASAVERPVAQHGGGNGNGFKQAAFIVVSIVIAIFLATWSINSEMSDVKASVAKLEVAVAANTAAIAKLQTDVDRIQADLSDLSGDVSELRGAVFAHINGHQHASATAFADK